MSESDKLSYSKTKKEIIHEKRSGYYTIGDYFYYY